MIDHLATTSITGPVLPMGSSPELNAWLKRFPPYIQWWGHEFYFAYEPMLVTDSARRAINAGNTVRLTVPYWGAEIFFLVLPLVVSLRWWRGRRNRNRQGLCPTCGFDLRATPDRCPECGTVNPDAGKVTSVSPS